jgi:hypothetical protein
MTAEAVAAEWHDFSVEQYNKPRNANFSVVRLFVLSASDFGDSVGRIACWSPGAAAWGMSVWLAVL